MSTEKPDTVEEWAPMFTRHFNDEQIIRDCLSLTREGHWCRLCDAHVKGSAEQHRKQHERELRDWRAKKRKAVDQAAKKRLAEARRLKREADAVAPKTETKRKRGKR